MYAKGWDEKLLAYLWKHKHMTPFEMAGMIMEVQAPIFVLREWQRHRTQSFNELSARYSELPDLFYVPSIERIMHGKQAIKNKQGSDVGFLHAEASTISDTIRRGYERSRSEYSGLLHNGVARELSRLLVPVGQYSRMRASANLRNWLDFLTLRTAEGAQYEIRVYANVVAGLIAETFPRTYALWAETQKAHQG